MSFRCCKAGDSELRENKSRIHRVMESKLEPEVYVASHAILSFLSPFPESGGLT